MISLVGHAESLRSRPTTIGPALEHREHVAADVLGSQVGRRARLQGRTFGCTADNQRSRGSANATSTPTSASATASVGA